MEKFYQKKYEKENLYATLCYDVAQDFIKNYWADCILSMQEITEEKDKGESRFIVVFRRCGAELFPVNKGITERFTFYKKEEKEAKIFLLDYESETIYSLSWEEAEDMLNK